MLERNSMMENLLLDHIYDMSIASRTCSKKKLDAIMDPLVGILVREGITQASLVEFIDDVKNDTVFDIEFFNGIGGNIKDFINPKWCNLLMSLWRYRSVGLGTPNAASGEGEFMFLFSSKNITKPTKGDLLVNGQQLNELKGNQARVMGTISGSRFRQDTLFIVRKFGLNPNKTKVGKNVLIDAAELEKSSRKEHWESELKKLDLETQKEFLNEWLCVIDSGENHMESVIKIFHNDVFNQDILVKEIIKILFADMKITSNFILSENVEDIKIISDVSRFNEMIDNNTIIPQGDYFRINQNFPIGWYIM